MRKPYPFLFALLLLGMVADAAPPLAVRLQHLPPAVRETVRGQLGDNGKLGRVAKSKEDDQTVFEVAISKDGKKRDFTIAADGSVLEKEVFFEELPAAAQKTIFETTHGAELDNISQSSDEGEIEYDVEFVQGGVSRDFTVGAGGKLLGVEVPLAETPAGVQKTIREKAQGATIVEIDRTTEDGEPVYNVEMKKNGHEQDFSVSADGEFLGLDVSLEDAPMAVRKTIRAEAGRGTIGDVTQTNDEDGVQYEAEITDGTSTRYVTVDADGTLDSVERPIAFSAAPAAVQSAVNARGGKVVDISKVVEDGEVTYEIDLVKAGTKQELTLTAEGKVSE